jgi:hypothetical protein
MPRLVQFLMSCYVGLLICRTIQKQIKESEIIINAINVVEMIFRQQSHTNSWSSSRSMSPADVTPINFLKKSTTLFTVDIASKIGIPAKYINLYSEFIGYICAGHCQLLTLKTLDR